MPLAPLTIEAIEELIEALASELPFPTTNYTDMGSLPWTPQLHFGPIEESTGLPSHRVGIDADSNPVWWIDLDGGQRTILLDELNLDQIRDVAASVAASQ